MFYYCLSKKRSVNFVLIDKYLNFIYFNTDDILKQGQNCDEEYDLYKIFYKSITQNQNKVVGDAWDILEN